MTTDCDTLSFLPGTEAANNNASTCYTNNIDRTMYKAVPFVSFVPQFTGVEHYSEMPYFFEQNGLKAVGASPYGKGAWAAVWMATWYGSTRVAVKVSEISAIDREYSILSRLHHPCITTVYERISAGRDGAIIMEPAKMDLKRALAAKNLSAESLEGMALECAEALYYLERQGYAHLDVAARNFLVFQDQPGSRFMCRIKLADFGTSIELNPMRADTAVPSEISAPIRWSAPEVLIHRKASHKSDIWSYGVLLFEIFTRGSEPYARTNIDREQMLSIIEKGIHLPRPLQMPNHMYIKMQWCLLVLPELRPRASEVINTSVKYLVEISF